jgi:site-specific DNA-methyltransferase (adenine-specific)
MSQIICADVVEHLQVIHQQGLTFKAIVADPPYNIGKNFGTTQDTMPIDAYIEWTTQWVDLCLKVLANDGLLYIYGFPEVLARIAACYPLEQQRILAWHYTNKTTPYSTFWQRSYESILCLWRDKRPPLNIDAIREPYTETYLKCAGRERKNTKGRFGQKTTTYLANPKGALPRDVIKHPALAGGAGSVERHFVCKTCNNQFYPAKAMKHHKEHDILQHPTQKPMALTQKLLLSVLTPQDGGRVLVPFAGSGSECVTAKTLGFEFLGVELNPDYVNFANKWLESLEKVVDNQYQI